jgi:hypothetical protein
LTMIAFMQEQVVGQFHWLTPREFIDGLALSQFTPGPLSWSRRTSDTRCRVWPEPPWRRPPHFCHHLSSCSGSSPCLTA